MKKPPSQKPTSLADRLPPQNIEAERAVLGAILFDSDVFDSVASVISPEDFYRSAHLNIFEAMTALNRRGEKIDLLTLSSELGEKLESCGGNDYLIELLSDISTAVTAPYHAELVRGIATLRRIISFATDAARGAYEMPSDVREFITALDKKFLGIIQPLKQNTPPVALREINELNIGAWGEAWEGRGNPIQISTGFIDLDRVIGGLRPGALIILAARPGGGKTTLALNIASNIASRLELPTLIFTLEMPASELGVRFTAAMGDINNSRLLNPRELSKQDWDSIYQYHTRTRALPIFVSDKCRALREIRAALRQHISKHGRPALVVVDYLQLVQTTGEGKFVNENERIGYISNTLKSLALEYETTVLAACQMSREIERAKNPRAPTLSDLRGSGVIEQDADIVLFLNPPLEKNLNEFEPNPIRCIIAKHRQGGTGYISLYFDRPHSRFVNYTGEQL